MLVIFTCNRRRTTFFIALMFSGTALGTVFFSQPPWRPSDFAVRHWQKQLATVPDEKILSHLRRIGQLGDAATPVLVKALASPRSHVVEASYQVLNESLDAWQLLRSRDSSPMVFQLTDELYKQSSNFGPTAKPLVNDMALRALLWPMDAARINRTELITKCEYLMVASVDNLSKPSEQPTNNSTATLPSSEIVNMSPSATSVRPAEASRKPDFLITPKTSLANGLGPPWQTLERPVSLVGLPAATPFPGSQSLPNADKSGR